jgi:hypothetical protein
MPVYYIIFSALVITKLLTYIFDIQCIKYFCHVLSFFILNRNLNFSIAAKIRNLLSQIVFFIHLFRISKIAMVKGKRSNDQYPAFLLLMQLNLSCNCLEKNK